MRRKRLKSQGTTTNLQEQQEGNVDTAKSSIREKAKSRTLSSPLERKTLLPLKDGRRRGEDE